MKLALFTIAMLVISSSAFAQPGQNAWDSIASSMVEPQEIISMEKE